MRGDPHQMERDAANSDRAARDRYASERESYRAEAEAYAGVDEEHADPDFIHAMRVGEAIEQRRVLAALSMLEKETAALWQEGSAVTRAVAAYTKAVRGIVEGRT